MRLGQCCDGAVIDVTNFDATKISVLGFLIFAFCLTLLHKDIKL